MNKEYETEIDLIDMFFYVMYKWRRILMGMLVFGILAGGCKFLLNTLESLGEYGKPAELREYEIKLAEYELEVASFERNQEHYQMQLEQQQTYMDKSILMKIVPYNVPTASMDIFVKLDGTEWENLPSNTSMDPTDSLINAYTSNFKSTIDWTQIEDLTAKETIYLKELFSVSVDYNGNTFTVSVRYTDGDTAQQILDIVAEQIMAKYQKMDTDVNKHTISIINRSLTYNIDNTLADAQKRGLDAISDFEQAILECQTGQMELKKPRPPHSIRKFFILGLIAGGFLTMSFYAGSYIFGSRIHGEKELKNRYGYTLLGVLPRKRGKNTRLSLMDYILNRLDGTNKQLDREAAVPIISANIKNMAGENKELLMIGTVDSRRQQELAKEISLQLGDYILKAGGNMNRDTESLELLAECDAVVIVEERDKSLIADIQNEQEGIAALNKKVIGYVLL